MTIKRLVCAVDLTKASRSAFDRALSLARACKSRLHIVHAVPSSERSWRATERIALLTALHDRAERDGVSVRVIEQQGDPADLIVQHANAIKADLVVLGSNRRRGWQRFRQGSVGERVLRRAPWALLIVPSEVSSGGRADLKVLCAVDLTKASEPAFDRALSLVQPGSGRLYILHAVPANKPFSWRAAARLHLLTRLRSFLDRIGDEVGSASRRGLWGNACYDARRAPS